ncbi:MAG: glycosyltransferase [Planctomycetota bacterium]|nr:MAG: glycosyltransferase [Planctomycetota bacterium]REK25815.1 MAG: glycosyltransferase [Planctomycetota bacterium]REK49486.1 MAG: glycosyltransferase [Planctomycetota bacterium]
MSDAIETKTQLRREPPGALGATSSSSTRGLGPDYQLAVQEAMAGRYARARELYRGLLDEDLAESARWFVRNDLAVLNAMQGKLEASRAELKDVIDGCPGWIVAKKNAASVHSAMNAAATSEMPASCRRSNSSREGSRAPCKISILSFLFNWPSTGGGIVHTVELVDFLGRAGYIVEHVHAKYEPWGIGRVDDTLPIRSIGIEFDNRSWNVPTIQAAFRRAVDQFEADVVIITDCWNFKPYLAQAVEAYPYVIRQQALECICPLNNLRLLIDAPNRVRQCAMNQFTAPDHCTTCLADNGVRSGQLHIAERELSRVGSSQYRDLLYRTYLGADAVLVLNPLIQAELRPYCESVEVVTWGMDPDRFPWPSTSEHEDGDSNGTLTLLMAGAAEELIKGLHVLRAACREVWRVRQDFRLRITSRSIHNAEEFIQCIGWQSQEELPTRIREADIIVMPTIAQEGLGRSTVEAMGAARPVIASAIGGLPYTVSHGVNGLLFEPGDADDLARQIVRLLDDPDERRRMGLAGRRRFETEFTWPVVIEDQYRPLLSRILHAKR